MPTVRYTPKPGGTFIAPTLQPGATLEVTTAEAEHLIATGAFEAVDTKQPTIEAAPSEKPSRKESK